jgi:nitrite reductase/ring-hydroxylating ferredoxin subunit/uncharacterized membrane protein
MTTEVLREVTHVMDALTPEQNAQLDEWADRLQQLLHTLVDQGGPAARRVKNWLNGTWLGHALHPALTDVPLGAWSAGAMLDLIGAKASADAAHTIGVLSAIPTALAGAADWSDTEAEARRTGLLHALLNSAGLVLLIGSLFARRNGRRGLGILLSTAGLSFSSISAWLGGHMVYVLGVAVGRNAFEPTVDDFLVVASADTVPEGKLFGAALDVDGTRLPLVLYRKGDSIAAIGATCTHWGANLAEGQLVEDDCVQCPWHASRFSLLDGQVHRGPAAIPAHVFEARIRQDQVEVRRRRR